MIYFGLIIPVIVIGIMILNKRRYEWYEYAIPAITTIVLVFGGNSILIHSMSRDVEYWSGWVVDANYVEAWTEAQTVTVPDADGKGTHTETVTIYHPPEWFVHDSNGLQVSIASSEYARLKSIFGKEKYQFRFSGGNIHTVHWNGDYNTMQVSTTCHYYKNKIIASDNIINRFQKVSKEDIKFYRLWDYCGAYVLGGNQEWDDLLAKQNALIARQKEIKIWVLFYHNLPSKAGELQEDYWQGGNKNDLCICIGLNKDGLIDWSRVFSWCDNEEFKCKVRNLVLDQKGSNIDFNKFTNELIPLINNEWQRKHFKDFEYLNVNAPFWGSFLFFILILLSNIGYAIYVLTKSDYYYR